MFTRCCGCDKNTAKDIGVTNQNASNTNTELEKNEPCAENHSKKSVVIQETPSTVTDQPKSTSDRDHDVTKRQSVVSDVKIEISDNDDDEVFCEGVGPPVKLASNLGTPHNKSPLPRWFSEEDDHEVGGIQEPPATPVGRDELALRRHRLFSELLNAAQNATEHRVRFDPLGPVIAGVADTDCCHSSIVELDALVVRLENTVTRLEDIYLPIQALLKTCNNCSKKLFTLAESPKTNMSVQGFSDILQGPFAQYLAVSQKIGGDVAQHSQIVNQAFQAQYQYLNIASQSKKPSSQSEQMALLQPTSQQISAIQDFREKHRTSTFFNHLSAISESIPALGWVTVSPAPAPYVKEMNDAGQFYTNRVLKDWKEKDKKHVEWVKAWIQTLSELQAYVKQHHTTGLVWAGKGAPAVCAAPPPPPGCPPPPPPALLGDLPPADDGGDDRSALFAQINQGEDITKNLKRVTADMQTHKNPTLRQGPAPFKAPTGPGSYRAANAPSDKPPVFTRDGKKWLIEYQKGNHNLLIDNAEMNNVVYLFNCSNSTVTVKGKINSITLDLCKKTSVVFDSLVSSMEFINCQSVQMQVFGKVPTISIDKTDGCQIYLSPESLDVEIVSSKSSEMNVMVPKGNGDYTEYPVPEQYKTTIVPGKGLQTTIVENKG